MSNKFWLVWNENDRAPRHKHKKGFTAIAEANRLADASPYGTTFHVLEANYTAISQNKPEVGTIWRCENIHSDVCYEIIEVTDNYVICKSAHNDSLWVKKLEDWLDRYTQLPQSKHSRRDF